MAERIPLNFYKRVTKKLTRTPQSIYTTPPDRAGIIISTLASNITDEYRYISFSLSSAGETFAAILSNTELEPLDYVSLLPSKIVLKENDFIIANVETDNLTTINDEGLFWFYDIPTEPTNIALVLQIKQPTEVTIDWGVMNSNETTTLVGNGSEQYVSFYYDDSDQVGTNITLSILESNNTQ